MSEQGTMMKDRITIKGRDGAFGAYIARPKVLPAPAVVVLHEGFGGNADIRKTCDELAEQGSLPTGPTLSGARKPVADPAAPSGPTRHNGLRPRQPTDKPPATKTITA